MKHQLDPELQFGQVSLKVSDLERSLQFYSEVLGLTILSIQSDSRRAQLTVDGKTCLIELIEIQDAVVAAPRSVQGLYHFALLVPARVSLGLVLRQLIQHRIPVGHSDHDVSEALYINDPDHNGIEIYRDRPKEEWKFHTDGSIVMGGAALPLNEIIAEASELEWTGMPAGTIVGHLHFHVQSIMKAKQFYCELLGFDMMADMQEFGASFISAGGYHHHFGLNRWAGSAPLPTAKHTGIESFTIKMSAASLDSLKLRLQEAGIDFEATVIDEKPVIEFEDLNHTKCIVIEK